MSNLAALLIVPLATAMAGYLANRVGQWMIFHLVLPRRAGRFSQEVARLLAEKLLSPRELARKLEVAEIEKRLARTIDQQTREITREAAELVEHGAWEMLPPAVQSAVESQLREQARAALAELIQRMEESSDELLDYRELVIAQLSGANTDRLARLTKALGASELRLIGAYAAAFGLVVGLFAACSIASSGQWWLLPVAGGLVGLATNTVALLMIFRPFEPRRVLGLFSYQGLFPRRQAELARDYGRLAAEELLTATNLTRLVQDGEAGRRFAALIESTVRERMLREWKKIEPMVPVNVKPEVLEELMRRVVARAQGLTPFTARELAPYLGKQLDVAGTIERRLAMLSKPDFERVLRGLFAEDEGKLVLAGGVVGALLGGLAAALVVWT